MPSRIILDSPDIRLGFAMAWSGYRKWRLIVHQNTLAKGVSLHDVVDVPFPVCRLIVYPNPLKWGVSV